MCTRQGQVFKFGSGDFGQIELGHGDLQPEDPSEDGLIEVVCSVPQLVDELLRMKAVCVAAGCGVANGRGHTAVCTDAGQLYTLKTNYDNGRYGHGQLGHGDRQEEWVPLLVQELVGANAVGVDAGDVYT